MLTKGLDNVPGTSGNDTIIGAVDDTNAELNTMSALDVVNGGAGVDTLRVSFNDATVPAIALPNLSNVEIIEVQATQDFTLDTSNIAAVTDVNVTKATGMVGVEGSDAQNISVAGTEDDIAIDGGKNITVTDATADTDIDIGNGATGPYAAGTITVTDTKQGTGDITIDGGTDVTVTATVTMANNTANANGGDIAIGANKAASGAVIVTQNLNSDGGDADGDDLAAANIAITGGTTVDVTVNATVTAKADDAEGDIAIGTVTVEGDGNTTSVKVTQNATATEFETAAVALVKSTQAVTFKDLAKNATVTVNGLTFTAAKDLTAAQVAQAFANLAASDKQEDGGPVANGFYTNAFTPVAGWTSGAANGATVTFTAPAHNSVALVITSNVGASTPTAAAIVAGTAATGAASTTNDIAKGKVTVVDNDTTDAITTVTLDGFDDADIGVDSVASAVSQLDALTTLNLANNTTDDVIEVGTAATTLELNVNNIRSTGTTYINLDNDGYDKNDATVETLTINATGAASRFELVAGALKNLTVNASVGLNVSDSAASYATALLEAVDVNGAGAVNLGDLSASVALNSFDASGNTGGVTATVEGDGATLTGDLEEYVFSGGNDTVTVEAATGTSVDVKVSLGAGDDKLTLATGINTAGAVLDGGTGTNTLHMAAADAVTASATNTFEGKIQNFQKLSLGNATTAGTVDLANMDDISYVISANSGTVATGATAVYAGAVAGLTNGDTIDFTYEGDVLQATIAGIGGLTATAAEVQAAINTALTGGGYTAGDVVATFTNGGADLTLTAAGDPATDTLTGEAYTDVDAEAAVASVANAADTVANLVPASILYAGAVQYATTNDTIQFVYEGDTLTATLTVAGGAGSVTANEIQTAVNVALAGAGYSTGAVVATLVNAGADIRLTAAADPLTDTLVTGAGFVDVDDTEGSNAGDVTGADTAQSGAAAFTVYAGAVAGLTQNDTIDFTYEGTPLTATIGITASATATAGEVQTAINLALVAGGYSAGDVVASFTGVGSADLTLTAAGDPVTDTLTGEAYTDVDGEDAVRSVANAVDTAAGAVAIALTLDNMANDGTLELTTAGEGVNVIVTDAGEAGQTSNILNVVLSDSLTNGGIDVGSVVVNDVETINVKANDAVQDADEDGKDDTNAAHTIDVDGDSVITINVEGAGDVTLTTTSTVLETVNATNLTGKLTYNALVAETVVTGGSGADILVASANEVVINGGAGNDTITIAGNVDKVVVDGGAGSDTFIIAGAASNKDSYAVFKNVGSGDIFDFGTLLASDVTDFRQAKITLSQGATESSQAYLNQAVKDLAQHEMGWFQYGGNTFIVVDKSNSAAAFQDGTDVAIMLTGLVDLSTGATFNSTSDLLEII